MGCLTFLTMKQKSITIRSRWKSIAFAIKGMQLFFRDEANASIHFIATIAVLIASFYFKVPASEIIAVLIVIGLGWIAEMFNSVVEYIMDFICPGYHPKIAVIKDLSAAAVLVAAILAAITGLIVFIPKII